jgi:hypothetical protein
MPTGFYPRTEKHIKALSESHKGISTWNKDIWHKKLSEKKLIKLYLSGWTIKRIARKYKITPLTLRRALVKNGIEIRPHQPRGKMSSAYGKKLSKATRKKMSLASKGKPKPWQIGRWFGENNPRWVGGPEKYDGYTSEFRTKIRHVILKRDKNRCRMCTTRLDLIVHHIDSNKRNNSLSNLITLCRPCHTKVHVTKNKKYSDLLNKILGRK